MKIFYRLGCNALLLTIAAINSQGVAASEYYQWRDSSGTVIHSDQPPPDGVDYKVVPTIPAFGPARGDIDAPTPDEGIAPVSPGEAAQANKNPELCEQAKQDLAVLHRSEQVKMRGRQGEERLMTPEEIIVERQKAKAEISVYCN